MLLMDMAEANDMDSNKIAISKYKKRHLVD